MDVNDSIKNPRLDIIASDPMRVVNAISKKYLKHKDAYDGNFTSAIYEYLTLEEATLLLETLSKCECCDRHQTHRPSRLVDFDSDQACGHHHADGEQPCKCPCRHFSRWICLTFQYIDTYDDA